MSKEEAIPEAMGGCDVCTMNCADPENLLGLKKYNFKYMCMPKLLPWFEKGGAPPPTTFSKDEKVPLLLSLLLGFQHALAMMGGIATSGGYLITNDTCLGWQKDSQMCDRMPWMISCAWLTSGILTIVQVFRLKVKGTPFYIGTGLISVMGTSFTFLPLARTMTLEAVYDAKGSWPACSTDANGDPIWGGCCFQGDCHGSAATGYGKFLGTCLVGALTEVFIAMMPPWLIKKLFPPVVVGSVVMLIGGSLIGAGVKYVGGGVFCAENTESRATTKFGPTRDSSIPQLCFNDNGEVALSFGSSECAGRAAHAARISRPTPHACKRDCIVCARGRYVGLGMSVIMFSIMIQIWGSPFMKSAPQSHPPRSARRSPCTPCAPCTTLARRHGARAAGRPSSSGPRRSDASSRPAATTTMARGRPFPPRLHGEGQARHFPLGRGQPTRANHTHQPIAC